jgi:hypothetical protein
LKRIQGDRGWEKDEEKMREKGDKGKKGEKGERSRGRKKGEEEWEKTTPCPPPHRFRDSFCLFGITNAHHTPVI